MTKLICPECHNQLKRKIIFAKGDIRKETFDSLIAPTATIGNHSYDALYKCKNCGFEKQKYFKYVSAHEDFETFDTFTGALSKYGVIAKTIFTILILLPYIIVAGLIFTLTGNGMFVYMTEICVFLFGWGYPTMFIFCAWIDHTEDITTLNKLDSEFMENKS
jgi:hypothetical protein